jgi:hypothetical protein
MKKGITTKNNKSSQADFDDITINSDFNVPFDKDPFSFDIDNLDIKRQETLKRERYRQDTKERKLLSHWVMMVVSSWLFLTILILVFNHFLCLNLSDTVCCMLLGTTTVNILGLAFIVLKGLFPEKLSTD